MRSAIKTAGLFFLFGAVLIFPLCAEPSPDEDSLPDEDFVFFEEFFIFEEFPFGEESFLSEETPPDEELFLSEESLSGEEHFLDEKTFPDDELFFDDETLLSEELMFDDDLFLDNESFAFEAPALVFEVPVFETRSFDGIFTNLSRSQRSSVMNGAGLRYYFQDDSSPNLIPDPASGIDLLGKVMAKKPSHIIEALVVVPYSGREYDMLDIYNALGRIENIKDYTVPLNGRDYNVFLETTRIQSARNKRNIPDPSPTDMLPFSETMYLCFKDAYLGNLYIRGDVSISLYGITYSMTNFTDVRYFLLPVMKAERFTAIIYLEPVKEGILIYCMSGFYLPGFIAERVNLTPNINRRITVFINWIADGLRRQERDAAVY